MSTKLNYRLLGKRLQEMRKCCHLTQAEFAERMGVSPGYYASLESGKNEISFPRFVQFMEITGASADRLLMGCGPEIAQSIGDNALSGERELLRDLLERSSDKAVKAMYDICVALSGHME